MLTRMLTLLSVLVLSTFFVEASQSRRPLSHEQQREHQEKFRQTLKARGFDSNAVSQILNALPHGKKHWLDQFYHHMETLEFSDFQIQRMIRRWPDILNFTAGSPEYFKAFKTNMEVAQDFLTPDEISRRPKILRMGWKFFREEAQTKGEKKRRKNRKANWEENIQRIRDVHAWLLQRQVRIPLLALDTRFLIIEFVQTSSIETNLLAVEAADPSQLGSQEIVNRLDQAGFIDLIIAARWKDEAIASNCARILSALD